VDFVVDAGGRLELFEATWTKLPAKTDGVNLGFARDTVGRSRVARCAIVCRARNGFPLASGIRAMNVDELA